MALRIPYGHLGRESAYQALLRGICCSYLVGHPSSEILRTSHRDNGLWF